MNLKIQENTSPWVSEVEGFQTPSVNITAKNDSPLAYDKRSFHKKVVHALLPNDRTGNTDRNTESGLLLYTVFDQLRQLLFSGMRGDILFFCLFIGV